MWSRVRKEDKDSRKKVKGKRGNKVSLRGVEQSETTWQSSVCKDVFYGQRYVGYWIAIP